MKKSFLILVLTSGLLLLASLAFGQYKGPGTKIRLYTVVEIKNAASKLDRSDITVKVKGNIIRQIDHDTYVLRDDSGSVQVQIDKILFQDKSIDEHTQVILIGEVDYDLLEPLEIEVNEILLE
jgi:uncharacterized protein (TIGR00156 family)